MTYFCIWFLLQDNPGEIEIGWDVIDGRLLELDGKIVTSLKCKKRNSLVESFYWIFERYSNGQLKC